MNERIKEIGRQAGFAFMADGIYGQRWYSSKCGMDTAEFEKFAELIVRECMEHANEIGRLNHGRGSWHSVRDRISIKMLGIYPKSGPIMPTATGVEE